jgi:hypothetical protein
MLNLLIRLETTAFQRIKDLEGSRGAFSSSLPGPEAQASDAPQPADLLCNPKSPPLILYVPASAARCFHVHKTRETLVAKGGTSWARIVR